LHDISLVRSKKLVAVSLRPSRQSP
jgi:hypothetical protein